MPALSADLVHSSRNIFLAPCTFMNTQGVRFKSFNKDVTRISLRSSDHIQVLHLPNQTKRTLMTKRRSPDYFPGKISQELLTLQEFTKLLSEAQDGDDNVKCQTLTRLQHALQSFHSHFLEHLKCLSFIDNVDMCSLFYRVNGLSFLLSCLQRTDNLQILSLSYYLLHAIGLV